MSVLLDNARRIFETVRASEDAENSDFALFVRPDGGLHLMMDATRSMEPAALREAALENGATTTFRITKSARGLRIAGSDARQSCVLEDRRKPRIGLDLVRDQALYTITSPLLISSGA